MAIKANSVGTFSMEELKKRRSPRLRPSGNQARALTPESFRGMDAKK